MTGLLLSRRHRQRGRAYCAVCNDWVKNATAPFEFTFTCAAGTIRERTGICAGCLREAVKVATEGRKVRR